MNCNKNPDKIREMFNDISKYYNEMNNFISCGTHYIIKYLAVKKLDLPPRTKVLDLCCGTGDIVQIISKIYPRSKVFGLDFSSEMLKLAKIKHPKGIYILGDCTNLPFQKDEFDCITICFGLRNIQNRQKALQEIYRVLIKNGKFLHLDFGIHNKAFQIFEYSVPIIAKIFKTNTEHYKYLINSAKDFPQPQSLIKEFENQGFRLVKKYDYFFGAISVQIMQKV